MKTLIFILFSYISSPSYVEEIYVEKIELNHVYGKMTGNHSLSQYILYKHMTLADSSGYRVIDWFMQSDGQRTYRDKEFFYFYFHRGGKMYKFKTRNFKEIKTNYDRETNDRKFLHQDDRPEFFPGRF